MRVLALWLVLVGPAFADDNDGDGFDEVEDCDDANADVFPGAPEWCDGIDNNCDDLVDNDCEDPDTDGDGLDDFGEIGDSADPDADGPEGVDDGPPDDEFGGQEGDPLNGGGPGGLCSVGPSPAGGAWLLMLPMLWGLCRVRRRDRG